MSLVYEPSVTSAALGFLGDGWVSGCSTSLYAYVKFVHALCGVVGATCVHSEAANTSRLWIGLYSANR